MEAQAFELLDYFYEQGGNFIDTSNNYQNEQSEMWIGEWMEKKNVRDEMIIATKYSSPYTSYKGPSQIHSNYVGNGTKALHVSVRDSLKKLRTDYIDVLYVHWPDLATSVPELMTSLNTLCDQGKVLYLGISDHPAWTVSKANEFARGKGMRPFVVYQGRWSAAERDFERDILAMCTAEGMGIAPWGALGGGKFKNEKQREEAKKEGGRNMGPISEENMKVSEALEAIAHRKNTALTSVALAYVMHKAPYVFPIVGGRKLDHLKGNIEALGLELSKDEIDEIEAVVPFDVGFPMNFLGTNGAPARDPKDVFLTNMAGCFDYVEKSMPIRPQKPGEE